MQLKSTILATYHKLTLKQLILSLTILSLLLAWRLIYIEHGWVNDDFVLYQESARLFSLGAFKQGLQLYSWPLYSGLISLVHLATGASLLLSAQMIVVACFGLTTYSFLCLIRLAGGGHWTVLSGAFILFSANYITGDVVAMLLRDPGFWGFFLTSLVFFILFYQQRNLKNALLWQVFAITATLFRIEGITFLVLLPLLVLIPPTASEGNANKVSQRLCLLLQAHLLNIILLLGGITLLLLSPSLSINDTGRLQEIIALFDSKLGEITSTLSARADILAANVFNGQFDDYAMHGLLFALGSFVLLKTIVALGWINVGLAGYYFTRNLPSIHPDVKRVLMYTLVLSLINALVIVLNVMLLATRYVIPFALVMMVFASFGLTALLETMGKHQLNNVNTLQTSRRSNIRRFFILLIMLGILASLIGNVLPKSPEKNYEQAAVAYLAKEQVSHTSVFFVSPRARFYAGANYAGRGYDYWQYIAAAINDHSIYDYDYLLLNLDVDENYAAKKLFLDAHLQNYRLVKEFYGYKNKKKIMLYKQAALSDVSINNR